MIQTGERMARKKQQWHEGDIFTVETSDGMHVVGQIVGREPEVLNSVSVAFFDVRLTQPDEAKEIELDPAKIFSIVFSTRDLLDSGSWKVVGNRQVAIETSQLPHEELRSSGFVGAKVIGSGILVEFLNAYYGLTAWDDWKEPDYLDRLLTSPSKKPKNVVYKRNI